MARVYPSPVTIAHKCSTAGSAQSDEKRELFWLDARRYGMPPADSSIFVSAGAILSGKSGISRVKARHSLLAARGGVAAMILKAAPVARDRETKFPSRRYSR
jgi:hypothetical protein